ncbi:TPR repeat-containing protein [Handroanthus impetiginosus]|uniref:TPR repeat-containing protein n=1 Tax=Handroanthus impetiginosus TaxID=429701 RepID=A0A2G9HX50_9LAMI|nr:TPR repeat-containing protein [Handroanthus impetiginosus]
MAVMEEESSDKNHSKSQIEAPASVLEGYNSDGYETASETELNDVVKEPKSHHDHDRTIDSVNSIKSSNGEVIHDVKEEEQQVKSESGESELNEIGLAKAHDAKLEGNSLFKAGLYEEALIKYDLAIQIAPDGPSSTEICSICYANRAACFSKLGKFDETVKECTKAIELNPAYIKALLRRGEAREKLEQYEESIAARRTIIRLKPLAEEKREKMKEEMIGKLKEMGNSILGRFGMSIDNFKAVKDPSTGSYSISFQQ